MIKTDLAQLVLNSLADVAACPQCGTRLRFGDLDCPHCGTDLEEHLRTWAERLVKDLSY